MNPQQPPSGQGPPQGAAAYYQQGAPPPAQQPYYGYGQQQQQQPQPPAGQYQGHQGQYPPQPPQSYGAPPPGQFQYPPQGQQHPGQYQNQPIGVPPPGPYGQHIGPPQGHYGQQAGPPHGGYGQQPGQHQQGQYGQPPSSSAPYGQQPPYQQQYPPQQYGAPPPAQQQWQQPPPPVNVAPTPASPGYDEAQKQWVQPVNTAADVETLRKAMKGMGCDEKALIKVFTDPKYANPWAMAQLVRDYNSRFMRDLAKDIESETRGDFETALLALIRTPLENDVYALGKALNRAGTDEDALMDVLLCRSNADIRAITKEYKRVIGRELIVDVKDDVEDNLYRLYSMVLAATRAEAAAPVNPAEIDHKISELQRATEGTIGANAVAVAQIFASSNDAQIHAMSEAYRRKYHRSLEDVIEKEFRGDMEDALLRMLKNAMDQARTDVALLRAPILKTIRKDRLFINRVLVLYRDPPRLAAVKRVYKDKYGYSLGKEVKEILSGDYEKVMLALLGEK